MQRESEKLSPAERAIGIGLFVLLFVAVLFIAVGGTASAAPKALTLTAPQLARDGTRITLEYSSCATGGGYDAAKQPIPCVAGVVGRLHACAVDGSGNAYDCGATRKVFSIPNANITAIANALLADWNAERGY